jgi:hypothetical protein
MKSKAGHITGDVWRFKNMHPVISKLRLDQIMEQRLEKQNMIWFFN